MRDADEGDDEGDDARSRDARDGANVASIARVGILLAVLFEFPLLERPFRLTALELLLPLPQFTGAITAVANTPIAAIGSVALITGIAARSKARSAMPVMSTGTTGTPRRLASSSSRRHHGRVSTPLVQSSTTTSERPMPSSKSWRRSESVLESR